MNRLTDRELIKLAQEGEQKAFSILMNRYEKGLLAHIVEHIATRVANEAETAIEPEDICMETFHKAFANISSYNTDYEFSTWLYNIGKNTAIDYSRKRKLAIDAGFSADKSEGISNYGTPKNSPEDKLISNQEYSILLQYIEELNEKYRNVAKMRFIDELAYEEIAQKLNMPLNTVRTRLKRAKEQLASKLKE